MFFMPAQELSSIQYSKNIAEVSVVLVLQVLYINSERDSIECASLMQFVLICYLFLSVIRPGMTQVIMQEPIIFKISLKV